MWVVVGGSSAASLIELAAYWWKGFSKLRRYIRNSICYHKKETENGFPGNGYRWVCSRQQGQNCCSLILARGLDVFGPSRGMG